MALMLVGLSLHLCAAQDPGSTPSLVEPVPDAAPDSETAPSGVEPVTDAAPDSETAPSGVDPVPDAAPDSETAPSGVDPVPDAAPDSETAPSGVDPVPDAAPDSETAPSVVEPVPDAAPDSETAPSGVEPVPDGVQVPESIPMEDTSDGTENTESTPSVVEPVPAGAQDLGSTPNEVEPVPDTVMEPVEPNTPNSELTATEASDEPGSILEGEVESTENGEDAENAEGIVPMEVMTTTTASTTTPTAVFTSRSSQFELQSIDQGYVGTYTFIFMEQSNGSIQVQCQIDAESPDKFDNGDTRPTVVITTQSCASAGDLASLDGEEIAVLDSHGLSRLRFSSMMPRMFTSEETATVGRFVDVPITFLTHAAD
eukprot:snap_masked-scaffold428_size174301-processed-gene-0.4 protein:Tk03104 transcript:snap_masked-scaffold428_size174301-processed-gene-0.4-mRNA-1 annotation:"hypothetical protein CLUG_04850"